MKQDDFSSHCKYQDTSPLFFAVIWDKIEIIKYFLEQKTFSVNSKADNMLLFEYTIQQKKFEIAEMLIQQPSITTIGYYSYNSINLPDFQFDNGKLHVTSSNYESFSINFLTFLTCDVINKEEETKINEIKKQIISKSKSLFGCLAAKYLNEKDFLLFLKKFEIDINSIEKKTKMTPIFASVFNNDFDVLNTILTEYKDTVKVNKKNPQKLTPLHFICSFERPLRDGEKKFLSLKNLDVNEREFSHFLAPLHIAVLSCNLEAATLLLNNPEIDVNIVDDMSNTPLHFAFQFKVRNPDLYFQKHFNMLKLLLEYSKKKVNVMDSNFQFHIPIQHFLLTNKYSSPVPKSNGNYKFYENYISVLELFVKCKVNLKNKKEIKQLLPIEIINDSEILSEKLLH